MDELLQYLIDHPSLVKGVGLGARSKEAIDHEWTNLATRLNAHGNGATKTGQRWKRYWADLKFKTKSKVSARRREASSTGGGPATLADLTAIDMKILSIIGKGVVSGDIQYRVPILVSSTQSSIFNTQSTSTLRTSVLNTKEIEDCLIDYHNEVIVTATCQRVDQTWVVELERRRVHAESRLADATMITAEAARVQAEASRMQAEALRMQAEASLDHAAALNKLLEILLNKST